MKITIFFNCFWIFLNTSIESFLRVCVIPFFPTIYNLLLILIFNDSLRISTSLVVTPNSYASSWSDKPTSSQRNLNRFSGINNSAAKALASISCGSCPFDDKLFLCKALVLYSKILVLLCFSTKCPISCAIVNRFLPRDSDLLTKMILCSDSKNPDAFF